jgi:uncharacterized membrane protein
MSDQRAPTSTLSDQDVARLLGRLLQVGVALSGAVTIIGAVLLLFQHGSERPDFASFTGQPAYLTSLTGIMRGVVQLRSESIVQLGIALLIATPVVRVAVTLFAFSRQRDRTYVIITALVLSLLLYGLIFGKA